MASAHNVDNKTSGKKLHLTINRTTATGRRGRCGQFTMVGPPDAQTGRVCHFRHKCKAYACPVCGPRKLRRARRRIGKVAQEKRLTRFASLTLDPSKLSPEQSSIEYLRDTWRKMRVSLKRYLGRSVEFIAVVELHESGIAHLHVLIGAYLPQEWLSKAWQGVGGGQIVDIRWVDVHRVAGYLSKYFTKESLAEIPAGVRRFSCSRGIAIWERKPSTPGWWLCRLTIDELDQWGHHISDEKWEEEEKGVFALLQFISDPIRIAEFYKFRRRTPSFPEC